MSNIPNIIHFVYGLSNKSEPLYQCYYIAILSAIKVNSPDVVYFHYENEPTGIWWDKLKNIITPIKVNAKRMIGDKILNHYAHISDYLRLEILRDYGGIYLDLDTICIKPYKDLLNNKFVIGKEDYYTTMPPFKNKIRGICNAVMFSEKNSEFINEQIRLSPIYFNEKWQSSIGCVLPSYISKDEYFKNTLTILPVTKFHRPTGNIIFENGDIPTNLMIAHYFGHTKEATIIKRNLDINIIKKNPNIIYSKIYNMVFEK